MGQGQFFRMITTEKNIPKIFGASIINIVDLNLKH